MSFYRDYNENRAIEAWAALPRPPYATLALRRLSPVLGAEIDGVDLSRPLEEVQIAEIRRALAEHLVLVFRGQRIGNEEHKRFAGHFGRLHRHVLAGARALSSDRFDPELLAWRTDNNSRFTAGNAWHNDVSCDPEPIFASFLRVTEVPEGGGGDTAFANLYLAYESLSEPIRTLIDGLTAVHDGSTAWTAGYGAQPEAGTVFPASEHPLVPRHPVTGRKFLFVNPAFTTRIPQLTRQESDAVLGLLFRHIERSLAFQLRVHWQPDSLVAWDNWATLHHAIWDYYPDIRSGVRVSAVLGHGPQH